MATLLAFWCMLLAIPLLGCGLTALFVPARLVHVVKSFPRNRVLGCVLTAIAWFWTAHELDVIGISFFDSFLKVFPGELWLLASVLTVLTCWWMENLLPIRALAAIFMLYPASLFPAVRLCDTSWRLVPVSCAYVCAFIGMYAMFYPWNIRRLIDWWALSRMRVRVLGVSFSALGFLLAVIGICAALGKCV